MKICVSTCFTLALCSVFLSVAHAAGGNGTVEWGYFNGLPGVLAPSEWHTAFSVCSSTRQSPIHILSSATVYDPNLEPFTFTGYERGFTATMTNNGHTIVIAVPASENIIISDGGLLDRYQLVQLHFHWGRGNNNGSEHWIDDKQYAAELHLVHYNLKYENVSVALNQRDGLAVLGVMIEIRDGNDNPDYSSITDYITNVAFPDRPPHTLNAFLLNSLLPENIEDYYRYEGSLTTPTCNEVVTWTVFTTPSYLSTQQILKFRTELHHASQAEILNNPQLDHILVDNHRPYQTIGSREVTRSKYEQVSSAKALATQFYLLSISQAGMVLFFNRL